MDKCNCGSGLKATARYDARNIFLCWACTQCWPRKAAMFRPDVHTDPNYWTTEDVDEAP